MYNEHDIVLTYLFIIVCTLQKKLFNFGGEMTRRILPPLSFKTLPPSTTITGRYNHDDDNDQKSGKEGMNEEESFI